MWEEAREKVMKLHEASVAEEVGKAGIERMVEERFKKMEKRRKVEFIKYVQAESGPGDVLNFGKYAGLRFAEVYMKDASYAEWALGFDKIKMWKLECFKLSLRCRKDELEETVKI